MNEHRKLQKSKKGLNALGDSILRYINSNEIISIMFDELTTQKAMMISVEDSHNEITMEQISRIEKNIKNKTERRNFRKARNKAESEGKSKCVIYQESGCSTLFFF